MRPSAASARPWSMCARGSAGAPDTHRSAALSASARPSLGEEDLSEVAPCSPQPGVGADRLLELPPRSVEVAPALAAGGNRYAQRGEVRVGGETAPRRLLRLVDPSRVHQHPCDCEPGLRNPWMQCQALAVQIQRLVLPTEIPEQRGQPDEPFGVTGLQLERAPEGALRLVEV